MTRKSVFDIDIQLQDKDGNTLLTQALLSHDVEQVQFLLRFGASPNIPNKEGKSALDYLLESPIMDQRMLNLFIEWAESQYVPHPVLHRLKQMETEMLQSRRAPLTFSSAQQHKCTKDGLMRSKL